MYEQWGGSIGLVETLRPYRHHLATMGQTSPPALAQPVLRHVVGESVADIGCGSGLFGYTMRVAWHFTGSWPEVAAPRRLLGLDFSPIAIARLSRFGIYDELVLAEADALPLEDASADTALSMENLEHLFHGEVTAALRELVRVARRRVVISTPAPWTVINRAWLADEIREARKDPVPLGRDEYLVLAGCIHKSSLTPEQMLRSGFAVHATPESMIYYADVEAIRLDRLGPVNGISWSGYPADDGRLDWTDAYLDLLHASAAVQTPPPPRSARLQSRIVRLRARAARMAGTLAGRPRNGSSNPGVV